MSATELEAVLSLAQRVLPDPTRFAEKLFQQAVVLWADTSGQGTQPAWPVRTKPHPDDSDGTQHTVVDTEFDASAYTAMSDTNQLLAAALGGCECWGANAACPSCAGKGTSGWTVPDAELFQLFVSPAVERLTDTDDTT
ncbi:MULTISPECIES: hypothetical protein [unclassified Microbacterium]|uniref:hypothetical protein n=1 Tax=unclassified Microbacterium TaxID=2609290 RepID=UPI00214C3E17|nr:MULTISPECIES: hypothetical protein [unclassified Microbacterium]MCR2810957.1 hypothetical protein [Microbacterium sp. zg.B185]WIM19644.1 hypothetical protein QNO12_02220 [Microbacterium sp. zg-B185]